MKRTLILVVAAFSFELLAPGNQAVSFQQAEPTTLITAKKQKQPKKPKKKRHPRRSPAVALVASGSATSSINHSHDVKATLPQGKKWAGLPLAKIRPLWLSRAQNSNQNASV